MSPAPLKRSTPAVRAAAVQAYADGHSSHAIGHAYGFTGEAVTAWVRDAGGVVRPRGSRPTPIRAIRPLSEVRRVELEEAPVEIPRPAAATPSSAAEVRVQTVDSGVGEVLVLQRITDGEIRAQVSLDPDHESWPRRLLDFVRGTGGRL